MVETFRLIFWSIAPSEIEIQKQLLKAIERFGYQVFSYLTLGSAAFSHHVQTFTELITSEVTIKGSLYGSLLTGIDQP